MAPPIPNDYWLFFADEARRGHSPLYERLALGIREDESLQALTGHARMGQPKANLIFAAVHYLLLGGMPHPLADHYPSVRPKATPDGDAFPLFRAFCLEHEAEIVRLIASRITNTNEVARSSSLYPAFDFVARETGASLHLIEIGPSAGFILNWDRYRYTYRRNNDVITRGPSAASVSLEAALHGDLTPPLATSFPTVASRVGLELNPVDLQSSQDRLWLKALIWPELAPRFARLDAAIATAREFPQPIVTGDALELLGDAVTSLPPSGAAVVYHSHVTYQFSEAMRRQLNTTFETLSHARPIYRISIEWDGNAYPVKIGRYENGRIDKRTIALCDPHGAWLEWRDQDD